MTRMTRLHEALLELGLEDLIPLPEAASAPEVLAAIGGSRPPEAIARALLDLLSWNLVQVWTGHWQAEPMLATREAAETLLVDEEKYAFGAEGDRGERVYYVNVANYRA